MNRKIFLPFGVIVLILCCMVFPVCADEMEVVCDLRCYNNTTVDYGHVLTAKDFRAFKKGEEYTISVELTADSNTEAYWNPNCGLFDFSIFTVNEGTHLYTLTFTALADGQLFDVPTALISKSPTGDNVAITSVTANVVANYIVPEYDYGDLMTSQLDRMECFIYVQIATCIILGSLFVFTVFFRRS